MSSKRPSTTTVLKRMGAAGGLMLLCVLTLALLPNYWSRKPSGDSAGMRQKTHAAGGYKGTLGDMGGKLHAGKTSATDPNNAKRTWDGSHRKRPPVTLTMSSAPIRWLVIAVMGASGVFLVVQLVQLVQLASPAAPAAPPAKARH